MSASHRTRMLPLPELEVGMIGAPPIDTVIHFARRLDPRAIERGFRAAVAHHDLFASRLIHLGGERFGLLSDPEGATFTLRPELPSAAAGFRIDEHGALMTIVRGLPGDPLVAASYTPLSDGSLLGISVSHLIGDGVSYHRFIETWSACSRGLAPPYPRTPRSYEHGAIAPPAGAPPGAPPDAIADRAAYYAALRRQCREQRISAAEVEALCARARERAPAATRQQAVMAQLLQQHAGAMVPGDGPVRLRIPIDVRGLHPRVSPDYVGNAFIDAVVAFTRGELAAASLGEVAAAIGAAIARAREPARVARRLSWTAHGVEQHADDEPIAPGNDLVCSNIAKIGSAVHARDFGAGPPLHTYLTFIAPAGFIVTTAADGLDIRLIQPVHGAPA